MAKIKVIIADIATKGWDWLFDDRLFLQLLVVSVLLWFLQSLCPPLAPLLLPVVEVLLAVVALICASGVARVITALSFRR